jgi:hypothetical protein
VTIVRKVIGIDDRGRPEFGGRPIMCAWSDCVHNGHQEHRLETPDTTNPAANLVYIFCSQQHKYYYLNSHRDLGNLPSGYKPVPGLARY